MRAKKSQLNREDGMRVLFISKHFPVDLQTSTQGTFQRIGMFIDAIKEIAQLDMLFYVSPDTDISTAAIAAKERELSNYWNTKINLFLCPEFNAQNTLPKWQQQSEGILNFFRQTDFIRTSCPQQIQAFEECLSRKPDAIFAHKLQAMCPLMLTSQSLPPIYFDLDDIEHIRFMREIKQPPTRLRTLLYYLQVPARWWGEYNAIRLAHQTFICSERDRNYLSNRWGLSGVVTIPNAITVAKPQSITPEPTLLLLGGYYYYPNANAANFLIEKVWSYIHQAMPEARLIIAGKEPHHIRTYATGVPGVEFTGFVDDIEALYLRSRVVCCPIFSGGGTRVKMIEAAAYGKPIVATQIGAEGLEMSDGQEFLLRNSPKQFAQACLELLQNDTLCEQLGLAARAAAIQHYDRNSIKKLIQKHLIQTIEPTNDKTYVYST